MPAANYDMVMDQGGTFSKVFTWKTGAVPTPVNLTGYTAKLQIKTFTGTLVIELSTANGRISLDASGNISLTVLPADTAAITADAYAYDLFLTSGGGIVTRLLAGTVTVAKRVTV